MQDSNIVQGSNQNSVYFCCVECSFLCWGLLGGRIKRRDARHLDRLVRRAESVVGTELDSLVSVAERRTLEKTLSILDNTHSTKL